MHLAIEGIVSASYTLMAASSIASCTGMLVKNFFNFMEKLVHFDPVAFQSVSFHLCR